MDEPFEIEARGAAEGINPLFGEWRQRFDLTPISYDNLGPTRAVFKQTVRSQLTNKFVFVGEISVTITLYLNEQTMLETPAYGDVDNYAKQLLDTLKGKGGLLIDDCQVEIKGGPDDFLPTPLKLHQMPDDLYYPISEFVWTTSGVIPAPDGLVMDLAEALAQMTARKRSMRHQLRQNGIAQFRAFQNCKCLSPVLIGFNKSRIVDSGFELVEV